MSTFQSLMNKDLPEKNIVFITNIRYVWKGTKCNFVKVYTSLEGIWIQSWYCIFRYQSWIPKLVKIWKYLSYSCKEDLHFLYIFYLKSVGTAAVAQCVRVEVWVVQIPAATDLKKGSDSSTAKFFSNRCEYHWSSEMTIMNGCPVSQ